MTRDEFFAMVKDLHEHPEHLAEYRKNYTNVYPFSDGIWGYLTRTLLRMYLWTGTRTKRFWTRLTEWQICFTRNRDLGLKESLKGKLKPLKFCSKQESWLSKMPLLFFIFLKKKCFPGNDDVNSQKSSRFYYILLAKIIRRTFYVKLHFLWQDSLDYRRYG